MTASPTAVVDAYGRSHFGRFAEPFTLVNLPEASLDDYPWILRQPKPWNAWLRALRLKDWHFISVHHDEVFLAFAVAQLSYVSNFFAYAVDKRTGAIHEWGARHPLGRHLQMGCSSVEGITRWKDRQASLTIWNQANAWTVKLELDRLKADLSIERDEAMALVFPLGPNRAAYTHKEAGNSVRGQIQLFDENFSLLDGQAFGASDWTRSFANYVTEWMFACFAGRDQMGRRIGINLSRIIYDDVNGTSQENTIWIEGKAHRVGKASFSLPETRDLAGKPWTMTVDDGGPVQLDLRFEPSGARREHQSFGLLASQFTQAFGTYSGTISVEGQTYHVKRIFGVAEKHYSRW